MNEATTACEEEIGMKVSLYDRMHLAMISLMHDKLYGAFVNPYKMLEEAGLKPGQTVLEIGCGPGFFTIPAAEIVGAQGRLHSLDINPAAVERVRRKVKEKNLTNVKVSLAEAAKTGLGDASVDTVFLFGILRSLKDLDPILLELHRVLRENATVSVQKSSWSEKRILSEFTKDGLFHFSGKNSRIFRFTKEPGCCSINEPTPQTVEN